MSASPRDITAARLGRAPGPKPAGRTTRRRSSSPTFGAASVHADDGRQPEAQLSGAERYDLIDTWVLLLEQLYVHLPQKRSLYGYDPIRALEALRRQEPLLDDAAFHRELMLTINRLRDAHTQYRPPGRIPGEVARLPFLVEAIDSAVRPTYLVSKVARDLVDNPAFEPGIEIVTWNGVAIDRVVDHHADTETGGRPDARRARALDSLTFRSLEYSPPPEEQVVDITFTALDGKLRRVRFHWRWVEPERAANTGTGAPRTHRAIDAGAEAVRRAKKLMFNPDLWSEDVNPPARRRLARAKRRKLDEPIPTPLQDVVTAKVVGTAKERYGYLRLWSFDVENDNAYLEEVRRLLGLLPQNGLIIDLRGNPGGYIVACERLLQLFCQARVRPARFGLRATRLSADLANATANQPSLGPWAMSLSDAMETGEPYSQHLPLTDPDVFDANDYCYAGPALAIVDANTYSCGDLFTAGFVDNEIGPVISVGSASGAGGANVWDSRDLIAAINATGRRLPPLPPGTGFTLALRRMVRAGEAEGSVIEDVGVKGQPYEMTRNDVLRSNQDLIQTAIEILRTLRVG
jgi:hypothetical protein